MKTKYQRISPYLIAISLSVIVAACATATVPTPAGNVADELLGVTWLLQTIGPAEDGQPTIPGSEVTLKFENDGTLNGHGGCNGFGGEYEAAANGSLTITNVFSTLMACADDLQTAQESTYFQALHDSESYELEGDSLRINYLGGVLVFTKAN